MPVIYRLAGIDGEAQEDQVENLNDEDEEDQNPVALEQKYSILNCLSDKGVYVLFEIIKSIKSFKQERYLAEWLLNLIGYAMKVK